MQPVETLPLDRVERMRSHIRERMHALTGQSQFSGFEIANLVRLIANKYETLAEQNSDPEHLSGPRWELLLRLLAEEEHGNQRTTPTYLSRCQNVNKNTISSLLRGLEEQGLIARQLDANDRRIFRITLTPHGRALIHETAPGRIEHMNQLISRLTPDEQAQLSDLLARLYRSMIETSQSTEVE